MPLKPFVLQAFPRGGPADWAIYHLTPSIGSWNSTNPTARHPPHKLVTAAPIGRIAPPNGFVVARHGRFRQQGRRRAKDPATALLTLPGRRTVGRGLILLSARIPEGSNRAAPTDGK